MSAEESKGRNAEDIRLLVYECIASHNEEVLVQLIWRLEQDYIDIARLSTYDEYERNWTHAKVINYLTYEN